MPETDIAGLIARLTTGREFANYVSVAVAAKAAAALEQQQREIERLNSLENIVWLTGRAATAENRAEAAKAQAAVMRKLLKQQLIARATPGSGSSDAAIEAFIDAALKDV